MTTFRLVLIEPFETRQKWLKRKSNYSIYMERYLKNSNYSILMNKRDLEKLSKEELIELLLKKEKKPKVVIVNDTKPKRTNRTPPPIPEGVKPFRPTQTVKKVVDDRSGYYKNPATNRWIKDRFENL